MTTGRGRRTLSLATADKYIWRILEFGKNLANIWQGIGSSDSLNLEVVFDILGASAGLFWEDLDVLEVCSGRLGWSWSRLGGVWRPLGDVLGDLGGNRGRLGGVLGAPWRRLGWTWRHLGGILEAKMSQNDQK